MLYLSTRNKVDSFTSYRVLHSETAPDGGMFLPMHLPQLDDFALADYERMSFGEAVASILNIFFGTQLSGWNVDFCVGRQAVELVSCGYRVSLAESWHNPAGTHAYFVNRLYGLVTGDLNSTVSPNTWFHTAVNIALLFGIYGKYCRQDIYEFDVAIASGDLQMLFAVRYAQKMGLPVRKVILGCKEDDGLWEFFSYGEYQFFRKTVLRGLEALLWLEFDYSEVQNYLTSIQGKSAYRLAMSGLDMFRTDIVVAVVGDSRVKNIIESTMHTSNYRMQDDTASAFGALQDYRSKTGENRNTLLFVQNMPEQSFI